MDAGLLAEIVLCPGAGFTRSMSFGFTGNIDSIYSSNGYALQKGIVALDLVLKLGDFCWRNGFWRCTQILSDGHGPILRMHGSRRAARRGLRPCHVKLTNKQFV